MGVRNLKILKGTIYAEVDLAGLDNGGWLTMKVKLGKGEDAQVTEALAALNDAVEQVAERHLQQASDSRIVDKRVRDEVADIQKRHQKALAIQTTTLVETLEREANMTVNTDVRAILRRLVLRLKDRIPA